MDSWQAVALIIVISLASSLLMVPLTLSMIPNDVSGVSDYSELSGLPDLVTDYSDLTGKPDIPRGSYTYYIYKNGSGCVGAAFNGTVLWYNVDDATVIQSALSACSYGGEVRLECARYNITSRLNMTNQGVVLSGWSPFAGTTTYTSTNANGLYLGYNGVLLYVSGLRNCVRDLFFYGANVSGTSRVGIYLHDESANCETLIDNVFINSFYDNVYISDGDSSYFSNSLFEYAARYNLHMNISGFCTFTSCAFLAASVDGVRITTGTQFAFVSCRFADNTEDGYHDVATYSYSSTISGCVFNGNGHNGLNIYDGLDYTVSGNSFYHNSASHDNTYDAIKLDGGVIRCTITGNTIGTYTGNNVKYGIEETAGCDYNIFVGNNVYDADTAGIHILGTNSKCASCYNLTSWVT